MVSVKNEGTCLVGCRWTAWALTQSKMWRIDQDKNDNSKTGRGGRGDVRRSWRVFRSGGETWLQHVHDGVAWELVWKTSSFLIFLQQQEALNSEQMMCEELERENKAGGVNTATIKQYVNWKQMEKSEFWQMKEDERVSSGKLLLRFDAWTAKVQTASAL